jgi:TfoX/Sxy family transcriptional regulator of competence genes
LSEKRFATGCSKSPAEEEPVPEVSDGRIYLKESDLEKAKTLAAGCRKTVPEGRYLALSSYWKATRHAALYLARISSP